MKKRANHPILRTMLIVLGLLFALFLYYLISSRFLQVRTETVSADVREPIRVVQLTDLHNAQFGDQNSKLVSLVKAQNPDLIVMTGDMLNRDDPSTEIVEH